MIDREQILTEAFIRMVYQFLEDKDINGELYIDSIAMSAGENAVEALVALGLATDIPGGRLRARWTEVGMAARERAGFDRDPKHHHNPDPIRNEWRIVQCPGQLGEL